MNMQTSYFEFNDLAQDNDVYDVVYSGSRRSSCISNKSESIESPINSSYLQNKSMEKSQSKIQRRHTILSNGQSGFDKSFSTNYYEFDSENEEPSSFNINSQSYDCKTLMRNTSMKPLVPKRSPSTKLTLSSTPSSSKPDRSLVNIKTRQMPMECSFIQNLQTNKDKKAAPLLPVRKDSSLTKNLNYETSLRTTKTNNDISVTTYNDESIYESLPANDVEDSSDMLPPPLPIDMLTTLNENHHPHHQVKTVKRNHLEMMEGAKGDVAAITCARAKPACENLCVDNFAKEIREKCKSLKAVTNTPIKDELRKSDSSTASQEKQQTKTSNGSDEDSSFIKDLNDNIVCYHPSETNNKKLVTPTQVQRKPLKSTTNHAMNDRNIEFLELNLSEEQIFFLKSKRIDSLSMIPDIHVIPENCPNWKKEHLNKKNRDIVLRHISKLDVSPIPDWKQAILEKRKKEDGPSENQIPVISNKDCQGSNTSQPIKVTQLISKKIPSISNPTPIRCIEPDKELVAKLKERLMKSSDNFHSVET